MFIKKPVKITKIVAREILDCRFNPTIQVDVWAGDDVWGRADVPAGRSRGEKEAWEIRDEDSKTFGGLGVQKAVRNIHEMIAPALIGMDVRDQKNIDLAMIKLDGTPNKKRIGGNAIIGVSMAVARAGANGWCLSPTGRGRRWRNIWRFGPPQNMGRANGCFPPMVHKVFSLASISHWS